MSNNESLVKTATHRGFEYSIKVAVGKVWEDGLGKFFAKCPPVPFQQFDSMALAEKHAKKHIDIFLDNNPSSWEQWLELFEECMIRSGYEDCELDSKMLKEVADKYAKFIEMSKRSN